jgi:hypothetical protein
MSTIRKTLSLDTDVATKLDATAATEDRTVSRVANRLLRLAMQRSAANAKRRAKK